MVIIWGTNCPGQSHNLNNVIHKMYLLQWEIFNMWSSNNEFDTLTFSRYSHRTNIYIQFSKRDSFWKNLRVSSVAVITHRPSPKSLDMKILKTLKKKFNMIPLEHSKTHSADEIHPTCRQDIGKVSLWHFLFLYLFADIDN